MATPRVKLSLQPVPKSIVRVSVAGEFLKNMGLESEADIRSVQQAVAEGLVSELVVLGLNAANLAKERFILRFDPLGNDDTIHLDLSDGKSTTEALDTGFAGAMAYSMQLMKRRALRPQFFIVWSAQAKANKADLAAACRRLNLTMDAGPEPAFEGEFTPTITAPSPQTPSFVLPSLNPPKPPMYPDIVKYLATLPSAPPNHTYKPVLTIKPAKEPGITYRIETAIRTK